MKSEWNSQRQRTAITRLGISFPARQALVDGLIQPEATVLDFGAGKGLDVRWLNELGFAAQGWDPYYSADVQPAPADTVLCIYVLNVIESVDERTQALKQAWDLASKHLVVATRLAWERSRVNGEEFEDGVLTSRNTFQHLFMPSELKEFVESTTGASCAAGAPGVVYAFRNDSDRLAFLARRLIGEMSWETSQTFAQALEQVVRYAETRGRLPVLVEVPDALVQLLGRTTNAQLRRLVMQSADHAKMEESQRRSTLDTLLFLGTEVFNGRARFSDLPIAVQADIKAFFPSYRDAARRADRLLLKIRDDSYVRGAMRNSVGKLTPSALYVHRSASHRMPVVLRLYEYCGAIAAGRPDDYTLVKLSHDRRAVSWLSYPEFDRDPHPTCAWSYSVSFPGFDVTYTDYIARANRPILHRKEEFVAEDYPKHQLFTKLTRQEVAAGLYATPSIIGTESGWKSELRRCKVELQGHRLRSARSDR